MESETITLREVQGADSMIIAELANSRKIWDNLRDTFPSPYTEQDALNFIHFIQLKTTSTTRVIEVNKEVAGMIGLILQSDCERYSGEIGFWLGERYWGLGIASVALKKMLHLAFYEFKLNRVFANVFAYNRASMKVFEKCGFQLEGIMRKAYFKNGDFHDIYRYAILVEELT